MREIYEDNHKYLLAQYPSKDIVQYAIKMIKYNKELSLIPVIVKNINNENELLYDITSYESVFDCIEKMSFSVKGLVDIIDRLAYILDNLEKYFMSINNIVYNTKNVYCNLKTNEIYLIYVPVEVELRDAATNRKVLLLNLLFTIKRLGFNNSDLDKAITDIRDDKGTLYTFHNSIKRIKESLDKEIIENKNEEIKKRRLFKGKKENEEVNVKKAEIYSNQSLYIVIVERGLSREYELILDNYLLGRMEAAVDIPIKSTSVGRIHGRIEREKNNYYYIDLNSKNGSFIGEEKLIPNKRYLIGNGTKLTLANVTAYVINNRSI